MAGPKAFVDSLKNDFPDEHQAIDTYMGYLNQVAKALPGVTLAKVLPNLLAGPFRRLANRKAPAFLNRPTQEVLEGLTGNQELIAALTGQWGDNGLVPTESSFNYSLADCPPLSLWWLLPGRWRLGNGKDHHSRHPAKRRRGVYLRRRERNPC